MRKFYFRAGLLALIGVIGSGYAEAQFKLNGPARILADESVCVTNSDGNSINSDAVRNVPRANILIGLAKGASAASLNVESLTVSSVIGSVATASIDADKLYDLAALKEVTAVELAEEMEVDMKHVRQTAQTGIATVHRNLIGKTTAKVDAEIGKPYLGEGVITSLYDTGLDPNHINFRTGENYETSRVKAVYVYTNSTGAVSQSLETPEDIAAFTTEDATATHGTHTLGIMAGSYAGPGSYGEYVFKDKSGALTDSLQYADGTRSLYRYQTNSTKTNYIPFYGVAPSSEIMIGCGPLYDNNMLDMAQKVRDRAKAEGKRAVMNLSIGNTVGPKDGSTLFNQGLAEIGKDVFISISSSNDGDSNGWITKKFSAEDNSFKTLLSSANDKATSVSGSLKSGSLQFWGNDEKPFTINVFTYNVLTGERIDVLSISEATPQTVRLTPVNFSGTSTTITYVQNLDFEKAFVGYLSFTAGVNSLNNRYNVSVSISSTHALRTESEASPYDNTDSHLALGMEIVGQDGQTVWANAKTTYLLFADNHYYKKAAEDGVSNPTITLTPSIDGFTCGNSENSINNLACGDNVFVVGNYIGRKSYSRLKTLYADRESGSTAGYNINYANDPQDINESSSYGTLIDGRQLPHVAMPGTGVISSNNTYYIDTTDSSTYSSDKYPSGNTGVVTVEENGETKEYFWCCKSGTSMSAPAFAGSCALFLEADPTLTYSELMDVLKETCRNDEYTAAKPERFGYGKVDVYAAIKKILENSAVPAVNVDDKVLFNYEDGNINVFIGDTESYTASVYNLNGIQVASVSGVGDLNISTSDLAKGVYVVNVHNGKFHKSTKIVVK